MKTRIAETGFTLLEVLAAIALLGFAFAIGLRAMSGSLGNSTRGEAMTQTALEAQSLLDMQRSRRSQCCRL